MHNKNDTVTVLVSRHIPFEHYFIIVTDKFLSLSLFDKYRWDQSTLKVNFVSSNNTSYKKDTHKILLIKS